MHKMLIGGQWIHAKDGRSLPVINPSDGQSFDEISRGGAHEIDLAVKAARSALSGPWGAMSLTDKGRDRKSTRLNSSHSQQSRMPSSA